MNTKKSLVLVVVLLIAIGVGITVGFFSASASEKPCVCPVIPKDTFETYRATTLADLQASPDTKSLVSNQKWLDTYDFDKSEVVRIYPTIYFIGVPFIWFHKHEINEELLESGDFDGIQKNIYDFGNKRWILLLKGISTDRIEGQDFLRLSIDTSTSNFNARTNIVSKGTIPSLSLPKMSASDVINHLVRPQKTNGYDSIIENYFATSNDVGETFIISRLRKAKAQRVVPSPSPLRPRPVMITPERPLKVSNMDLKAYWTNTVPALPAPNR
jgi:hypothetical protein